MNSILADKQLLIAFGTGITVGATAMGALNSEKTRTNLIAAYHRINLHNVLEFCGTVWMLSAATTWCISCYESIGEK